MEVLSLGGEKKGEQLAANGKAEGIIATAPKLWATVIGTGVRRLVNCAFAKTRARGGI